MTAGRDPAAKPQTGTYFGADARWHARRTVDVSHIRPRRKPLKKRQAVQADIGGRRIERGTESDVAFDIVIDFRRQWLAPPCVGVAPLHPPPPSPRRKACGAMRCGIVGARRLLILRNADLRGRLPPGEYRAGRSAPLAAPRRFSWTPKAGLQSTCSSRKRRRRPTGPRGQQPSPSDRT
jgi:hypothetical protein